ncbi:uncharacterized protein BJ212DRAFT_1235595, partial [Suillus subaureus]
LPVGIPTLQSTSTGNWTKPDNVFGMEFLLNTIVSCKTAPELRGPKTDHLPILITLELESPRTNEEPCRNWHGIDWDTFNKHLKQTISTRPALPLTLVEEFQEAAQHLTQLIMSTMEICVPHSKPCPHSKHWWTKHLSILWTRIKDLSKITYQMCGLPLHPSHEELKAIKEQY